MSAASCTARTPAATLIDYWFGELGGEREVELEEHLFLCEPCSARLRDLARLGEGIGQAMRTGHVPAVLMPAFIRRLQASGMRVREYRLQPGGSVNCTIAPDDDLVIAHLHAPLGGVQRLDLLFDDVTSGAHWRMEDVAFDASAEEVVLLPDVAELREVTVATQRVQLLAVERTTELERTTERVIADYTFNHSRYQT